jgi:hypothetical protein
MAMEMLLRTAFARLFLGASAVAVFACAPIEHTQAQVPYVPPPAQLPPPVFNPSSPYTVPQPSYRSISPAPSTAPNYRVPLPADERSVRTAVHTQRRIPARKTRTAVGSQPRVPAGKTRSVSHPGRPVIGVSPESYSYYYPPFGYDYGCAWRRSWDGYWFRTSPCS